MKTTLFSILLYFTTNNVSEFVKGKNFAGYIFDRSYNANFTILSQKERYTPTKENIRQVEIIINEQIDSLNKLRINQGDGCPIIDKKLKKYTRQYVGFINTKGEIVVWINLIWGRRHDKELSEKLVFMNGGCSSHWNVMVNLSTKELYDLQIGGIS